jgi:protein-arginine kinase activator protein McsA
MHHAELFARIESLREEIKLIQNQERFYRTVKRDSFEENAAHTRREIRLLEMQVELGKLQRR